MLVFVYEEESINITLPNPNSTTSFVIVKLGGLPGIEHGDRLMLIVPESERKNFSIIIKKLSSGIVLIILNIVL